MKMFINHLFTIILLLCLSLHHVEVYAEVSINLKNAQNEAQNLMSEYLLMTKGIGSEELIDKFGIKWLENANRTLAKYKNNKEFLKTKEFESLG